MTLRVCLILSLASVGLPVLLEAQDQPAQGTNDASVARTAPAGAMTGLLGMDDQSESGSVETPPVPPIVGGAGSSLAFSSEMERSNYLRAGVNVGAAYDDNALLSSGKQVGNTTYSVFPNIALEQSTSRMRWSL